LEEASDEEPAPATSLTTPRTMAEAVAQAKARLAAILGVSPDAIKITIEA
jgi:hypothetical protein